MIALFAFYGVDHLSAALYTVLIYTYPAMVAAGAALLGTPPTRTLWIALGLTLVGIALTVPSVFDGSADADGLGLVFTIGNAAIYAVYILATARLVRPSEARRIDGVVAAAWSLTGSLVFAIGVIAINGLEAPADLGALANLVGLAVISTVISGTTLLLGLARLGPAPTALVATLEPVLTLVWAVLSARRAPAADPDRRGRARARRRALRAAPGAGLRSDRSAPIELRSAPGPSRAQVVHAERVAVGEHLEADVVGAGVAVRLDASGDRLLVAPRDERVHEPVAAAVEQIVGGEPEPHPVVGVVLQQQVVGQVGAAEAPGGVRIGRQRHRLLGRDQRSDAERLRERSPCARA